MPTLSEVQARWAYSEVTDGAQRHTYDGLPWIGPLRERRRDGVPFANLLQVDRYALALACVSVRPNLMIFAAGVAQFQEVNLSRAQLGNVLVPQMVRGDQVAGMVSFSEYIILPAPGNIADARYVDDNAANYHPASDPLTLGRFFEHPVLLDGYHRAVLFWRAAPEYAVIRCWQPL
jgi:hypothetical protein